MVLPGGRLGRFAALAIASLALAAGCKVKTEGAPCSRDDQCPTGQACGYNRVCSVEAAGCRESLTDPPICYSDVCDGGPRECTPQANGICTTLGQAGSCLADETCGVLGGVADCLKLTWVSPAEGAVVGPQGTSATVKVDLTYRSPRLVPPAFLTLSDGSTPTLGSPSSPSDKVVTYTGSYTPVPGIEDPAHRLAVSAASQVLSPELSVNVDTRAPALSNLMAGCGPSPCVRDDPLTVMVDVDDPGSTVVASLDLDGDSRKEALVPATGTTYSTQPPLPLRQWPFGAFQRDVVVTVSATDALGNSRSQTVTVSGVTRARGPNETLTGFQVTSPAVEGDGTVVFGVAVPGPGATGQLRGVHPDGSLAWSTTLEISGGQGQALKAPPSMGGANIFAGSEDGRVYRVGLDGSMPGGTARFPTTTDTVAVPFNPLYTPIINVMSADHAYSAGGGAALYQFYSNQTTATLALPNPVRAAGAFAGANPFFATDDGAAVTLRRFLDALAPQESSSVALSDAGPPAAPCDRIGGASIGGIEVQTPLAVDKNGSVIAACANGQVHRVANVAPPAPLVDELLFRLPAGVSPTGSPIVFADDGILIPASDGNLWKLLPGGSTATVAWMSSVAAAAGEFPVGVAAADATGGFPALYATTSKGRLVALDATGASLWDAVLDPAGAPLGFPTIAPPPPGAPASALPTLYAGSSSGKLFRAVVDSGLDATPGSWPKAHHDIRNTGSNTSSLP